MSLKERLLLLITPLVVFPVVIGTVVILGFARDGSSINFGNYKLIILFAVIALLIFTIIMLSSAANSLTRPIGTIVRDIKRISHGEFDHSIAIAPQSHEMLDLVLAIEQMKHELKRRDEMIREEAAMGAVGRLASQIAHDLRSPLQSMMNFIGVSEDAMEISERDEFRSAALRGVSRVSAMADDLLDYMKARRIEKKRVHLKPFLSEIGKDVQTAVLNGSEIDLGIKIDEDMTADIDPEKISRVLVNLLVNSAQAINGGDGKIFLDSWKDANELYLSVSDTGRGIAPEDIGNIFEPSFTKGKKSGTGLGLAYAKHVVEAHGGNIIVESEPGKGTKFTIKLPDIAQKTRVTSIV